MGLISRLFGRERASPPVVARSADVEWNGAWWSAPSVTGIQVNQHTALNAAAVMACVTMLAEDVAKLPWGIYRHAEGEGRQEDKDHYLYDLLEMPNAWQNGFEFREQMQVGLILRGNAYAVIIRDGRGQPIKLVPVNPDWVALWESPDGGIFYRVSPNGMHLAAELRGMPFLIPMEDMLHLRGFSLNGLVGASRISLAKEAIGLILAQEQQAARFIGNGAKPSGVLTTEQKLDPAAATRMSTDWKAAHGGLRNTGNTVVLEQGLKFERIALTSVDAEFIASRQFQLQEVARIFRIPPHMIGELSRSTNNNISQQGQEYVNFTLTGYTNRWRAKFSSQFDLRRQGLTLEFDYNEITRADMTTRINNWRTMIMSMVAKPDEARIDLGMQPEGGEASKLHFPQNMAAAGSQSTGTTGDGGGRPPADQPPT